MLRPPMVDRNRANILEHIRFEYYQNNPNNSFACVCVCIESSAWICGLDKRVSNITYSTSMAIVGAEWLFAVKWMFEQYVACAL